MCAERKSGAATHGGRHHYGDYYRKLKQREALPCGFASAALRTVLVRRPIWPYFVLMSDPGLSPPERTVAIRRAAARLCRHLGWAPLHEVRLPNGRRADIFALCPDGRFVCVEVKSGAADFLADSKWPEYRDFSDALYFAVDADFPRGLLPADVGVIVTADREAEMLAEAPTHSLAPARRRALLQRFATLAACRLEHSLDPLDAFALSCE